MKAKVNTNWRRCQRVIALIALLIVLTVVSTRLGADTGSCGGATFTLPFVDVPHTSIFFCSIAEAYFSALTNGTDATHYSPTDPVTREQMAAFVTRTMDQSLMRGSRRAALRQFWTAQGAIDLRKTTVGSIPLGVESDGADVWVANKGSGTVSRVRASDSKLLDTWTGAISAVGVLCAEGRLFITGSPDTGPGRLYQIDPSQPAGTVTTVTSNLDLRPGSIAFDGHRVWTANFQSVSMVTINPLIVVTVSTGFSRPAGILYDGTNIWVTDNGDDTIKKLGSLGNILLSVTVGTFPGLPTFDGTNIWVPNGISNSVSVVRATGSFTGNVLATLTGNGLNDPIGTAFDGERILVTNFGDNSVSLWKASDLTPLESTSTGANTSPIWVCSDGLNFWIALSNAGELARF